MKLHSKVSDFDLKELCGIFLQKKKTLIISSIIGSLIIAFLNIFVMAPLYISTSRLAVRQLTIDYMTFITSQPILDEAIKNAKVDITHNELAGMITVSNPKGSRVLEISVTDFEPKMAKKLVDAVTDVAANDLVETMKMRKVTIIEYGNLPTKPTGRNLTKSFVSGGILGILLSSICIIIKCRMSEIMKRPEDIEENLAIPVLGIMPLDRLILEDTRI